MTKLAVIFTKKEITDKIKDVYFQTSKKFFDVSVDIADGEYGYVLSKEASIFPPWFPKSRITKYTKKYIPIGREIFINALKEVNEKYLLTKVYFYIMANGDPMKDIRKISMDELIDDIMADELEKDVLYKIVHGYEAYRKVEMETRAKPR